MTRSKLGLLGLCAVVFGLMAFSTAVAQAEAGAHFWILKATEKADAGGGSLNPGINYEADGAGTLHTRIAGFEVLFLCPTISAENAVLKAEGKIGEGAKIKFSGCSTDLSGKAAAACQPNAGGTEPGVIKTNAGHSLVALVGGKDVIKVLPDTGETVATIEMSKECAIGSKVPVIGKIALKDCEGLGRNHLVKHLIVAASKAEGTELWTISKTAEHEAFVLGSSWAFLTGKHLNFFWGWEAA